MFQREPATTLEHGRRRGSTRRLPTIQPDAAIRVEDLTVAYRRQPVLWDIHLAFGEGRLTGIVGPNGAGKSTLVKAICGLVRPASGRVTVFGKPLRKSARQIGYVPQRESVDWDFPIRVREVVEMGRYGRLGWFRGLSRDDRRIAADALDQVGMTDFADRQIRELSGGQQQRVFLARALAQDAPVYLLDEPFAGVDAKTEHAILTILQRLRDQGKAVVVVHHVLQTVRHYFDDVVLLNTRVMASGPVATTFTDEAIQRTYHGRLPLLDAAIESVRGS